MFAATTAVASTAVTTTAVTTTSVTATMCPAAMTNCRARMATAAAAAMTDRRMRARCMTDGRMHVAAMSDYGVRVTRMTAAGMSAMPMMPAIAAAPTDAGTEVLAAPVPAGTVPAVVVPAIIAAEPDELRALDHGQAIGRIANGSGRGHGRSPHMDDRCASNEERRGSNDNCEFTHDDLPRLPKNLPVCTLRELTEWH
jgi:hypothetical protein